MKIHDEGTVVALRDIDWYGIDSFFCEAWVPPPSFATLPYSRPMMPSHITLCLSVDSCLVLCVGFMCPLYCHTLALRALDAVFLYQYFRAVSVCAMHQPANLRGSRGPLLLTSPHLPLPPPHLAPSFLSQWTGKQPL